MPSKAAAKSSAKPAAKRPAPAAKKAATTKKAPLGKKPAPSSRAPARAAKKRPVRPQEPGARGVQPAPPPPAAVPVEALAVAGGLASRLPSTATPAPTAPPPAAGPAPAPAGAASPVAAPPGSGGPPGAAPAPAAEASKDARKPNRALQVIVEILAVVILLLLALVPIASVGAIPLDALGQTSLLALSSFLLTVGVLLYIPARYRSKATVDKLAAIRRRDDAILNALSIGMTVVLALITIVEFGAVLVFLKFIPATSPVVVTAAGWFIYFAAFTLLFLDLLLIARTSFDSRVKAKRWHAGMGYVLLGLGAVLLALAALKNFGLLEVGTFQQVKREQTSYIVTLAVFFQMFAFKMLLRYPSLGRVFASELELARKAGRDERVKIERRAIISYIVGLLFVLLSFLFIGGFATGQVARGSPQSTTSIILLYVGVGLAVFLYMAARFVQHRWVKNREKRAEKGELIAKRRMSPEQVANIAIYSTSGFFALLASIAAVLTFMGLTPLKSKLGTDLILVAFLIGVGPFGFRRGVAMRRIRLMDAKFPDFLRDLAEGLRAGMTLPRALFTASRGVYGALTPEIKHMSSQVEWGVSFADAIDRFAKRVKTPLIERTVSLITEASRAGGNTVDILSAAASDAREIQQILEDRKRQMGIYSVIIYVAYFVFLVVVFVLAAQFLPGFEAASKGGTGSQVGGLSFASFNPEVYKEIFFHGALVQGVGGGLVAGVMTEGHPLGGLKHSFIMSIVAWVFFRVFVQ